jgi:hypothetical protein
LIKLPALDFLLLTAVTVSTWRLTKSYPITAAIFGYGVLAAKATDEDLKARPSIRSKEIGLKDYGKTQENTREATHIDPVLNLQSYFSTQGVDRGSRPYQLYKQDNLEREPSLTCYEENPAISYSRTPSEESNLATAATMEPAPAVIDTVAFAKALGEALGKQNALASIQYATDIKPFDGENISDFMKDFEKKMKTLSIPDEEWPKMLERDVVPKIRSQVKTLASSFDWEETKKELLHWYNATDWDQMETALNKLEILNTQRPKNTADTHQWLHQHRMLWSKVETKNWKSSVSQSNAIYKAMPDQVITSFIDKKGYTRSDIIGREYSALWEEVMMHIRSRLEIENRDMATQERGSPAFDQVVTKEETAKNKRVLPIGNRQFGGWTESSSRQDQTTPPDTRMTAGRQPDQVDDLVRQMQDMKIALARHESRHVDLVEKLNQRHQDTPSIMRRTQPGQTNDTWTRTAPESAQRSSESTLVGDFSTNAIGFSRRNLRCYWCGDPGHFPDSCNAYKHDHSLGFATFDADARILAIGPKIKEHVVPPILVQQYLGIGSCLRRLAVHWVGIFEDAYAKVYLDQVRGFKAKSNDDWYPSRDERDIIDKHTKRINVYAYHPGRQHPETVHIEEPTATSAVITLEKVQLDQTEDVEYDGQDLAVTNANMRKRARVEEVAEDSPSETLQKSNAKTVTTETGDSWTQRIVTQLHDEVFQKKIGVPLRDLCRILPSLAKTIGDECNTRARGIEEVRWLDGTSGTYRNQPMSVQDSIEVRTGQANAIVSATESMTAYIDQPEENVTETTYAPEGKEASERCDPKLWELLQDRMNNSTKRLLVNTVIRPQAIPDHMQDLPYLQIRLGTENAPLMSALIDSGSQGNIISAKFARAAGLRVHPIQQIARTTSFTNQSVQMHGEIRTRLYLGNAWTPIRFYVAPDSVHVPLILGMPFIRMTQVSLEHSEGTGELLVMCRFDKVLIVSRAAGSIQWEIPEIKEERAVQTNAISLDCQEQSQQEKEKRVACSGDTSSRVWELETDEMLVPLDERQGVKILSLLLESAVEEHAAQINQAAKELREYEQPQQAKTNLKVNALYKRKGVKVHPRDDVPSDGSTPDGDPQWKNKKWEEAVRRLNPNRKYKEYITGRFSAVPEGFRMNQDRLDQVLRGVREQLTPEELEIFTEILRNREAALAWDLSECGRVDPLVAPPQVIKVTKHTAWQAKSIPIPLAMQPKLIELLKKKVKYQQLEESHGSYRNPYFLVVKKDGGVRFILSATKYNGITIRDANAPRGAEAFSEGFSMCQVLTIIDLLSGYDQVPLAETSRDMTTIATPLGLLRMCTLPQGATNSVAQFTRVMGRILYDLIPEICEPFLDDIGVKGPETTYNNEEIVPGVRRYMLEHLINIDKVLVNLELAGCTASALKTKFCQPTAEIVGYVCGTYGRMPTRARITKILEWGPCKDLTDVRSFTGLTNCCRTWIKAYAEKAQPLTKLLRKKTPWSWDTEQDEAMEALKQEVAHASPTKTLDHGPGHGEIVLAVDASGKGWGAELSQIVDGKRCPIRFESGVWTGAESKYDATKLECRAVVYALRRLRIHLYGAHFTLETDSQVLVHQLNGAVNDVPGAMVTRWISYILLFDFTARHVPGIKNGIADGLSRKGEGPSDQLDRQVEGDIEEFVDSHLNSVSILVTAVGEGLERRYGKKMIELVKFLLTMQRPQGISKEKYRQLRMTARKFFVENNYLWKRPTSKEKGPLLVVDIPHYQRAVIRATHQLMGHKGVEVTYQAAKQRYWWGGMWNTVKEMIACCETCQKFAPWRPRELSIPTAPGNPMSKVHLDTQHLPLDHGYKYLLEARCNLTGWIEAEPIRKATILAVRRFIRKLISRYGMIKYLVYDGGPEMRGNLKEALKEIGITGIQISGYNPKANAVNEAGHWTIASSLSKLGGSDGKWHSYLDHALLADRTAIRASHGMSAFYLIYGWEPILPLEVEFPTWRLVNWNKVTSAEDLFAARVRILQRKAQDVALAREKVYKFRRQLADRTDRKQAASIRRPVDQLLPGSLVLVYDVVRSMDMSTSKKLAMRWNGPFRIVSQAPVTGAYKIATLDGIQLSKTISGDHLKKFVRDSEGWWGSSADPWLLYAHSDNSTPDSESGYVDALAPNKMNHDMSDQMVDHMEAPQTNLKSDCEQEELEGVLPPRRSLQQLEVQIPEITRQQRNEYMLMCLEIDRL